MSQFDPIRGNQNFGVVNSVVSGNIADGMNSAVNISNNILGDSNNLSSKGETMFLNVPLSAVRKMEGYSPINIRLVDSVAINDNGSFLFYTSPNQDQIIGSTVPVIPPDTLPTTADARLLKFKFDPVNPDRNTIVILKSNLEAYGPDGEVAPIRTTSLDTTRMQYGMLSVPVTGVGQFDLQPNTQIVDNTSTSQVNTPGGATAIFGNPQNLALAFPGTSANGGELAQGSGENPVAGASVNITAGNEIVFPLSINGGAPAGDVLSGRSSTSGMKLTIYYSYWEDLCTNF